MINNRININSPSEEYIERITVNKYTDIDKLYQESEETIQNAFKRIAKKIVLKKLLTEQDDEEFDDEEYNKNIIFTAEDYKNIIFGVHRQYFMTFSDDGYVIMYDGSIYNVHSCFNEKRQETFKGTFVYKEPELAEAILKHYKKTQNKFEELKNKNIERRHILDGSMDSLYFPEQHFYTIHCLDREADEYQHFLCQIYDEYYEIVKEHSFEFLFPSFFYLTFKDREFEHCFYSTDTLKDDDEIFARDYGLLLPDWTDDYLRFSQNYFEELHAVEGDIGKVLDMDDESEVKEITEWLSNIGSDSFFAESKEKWEKYKIDCGYTRRHPNW